MEAVYARSPEQGPFIITRMLHPDPERRPTMAEVAKEMQPSHAEQFSATDLFKTRLGSDGNRLKVGRALDWEYGRVFAPLPSPTRSQNSKTGSGSGSDSPSDEGGAASPIVGTSSQDLAP